MESIEKLIFLTFSHLETFTLLLKYFHFYLKSPPIFSVLSVVLVFRVSFYVICTQKQS